ncbi:response regulator [Oryzomonas japonica]|uniref:Response regulator n=1 Tax=Oryzomonas japonica TaxID=2603858 RepID=A0A7J4ZP61_9BACT|nr:response regulator [Oryzomonas japonica]KAB0664670.1 response regulator [Oryzomonas japonica]
MGIKILLADDSITIQKVIGIIFGGDDYSLTVVDNGKDALDKAREILPDVLLIDAVMPGMTGYEVCEAVRATPALAAKPILLLTGSFEPFDENKAKSCGADDFLAKPFESQQIVTKVKALFDQGASRVSAAALSQPVQEAPAFEAPPLAASAPVSAAAAPTESAKPGDIWGAFTPVEEPAAAVAAATHAFEPPPAAAFEPPPAPVFEPPAPATFAPPAAAAFETVEEQGDVFSRAHEEPEFEAIQPPVAPASTGSQWIPVEEQTFEFHSEAAAFSEPEPPAHEAAFGDISFGETVPQPPPFEPVPSAAPVHESFEVSPPAAVVEASAPAPLPQAAAISEEQLRAAIAGASKEVIERIVWEIVPDLAEVMIREAILKIKEGR